MIIKITSILLLLNTISTLSLSGSILYNNQIKDRQKNITPALQSLILESDNELNNRVVFPTENGDFLFTNLSKGKYLLSVNDIHYEYDVYYIEVDDEVKAYSFNGRTGKGLKKNLPLRIEAVRKIVYAEESKAILSSIVSSPYMIVIGLTLLMFFCMKLVPQDELKDQFKEMNKQMSQFQKGNIFSK